MKYTMLYLGIALAASVIACGGGDSGEQEPQLPKDLLPAWATAVKLSVDDLRKEHLDGQGYQSDLDDAFRFMIRVCAAAVVDVRSTDLPAEDIQRACETAERAGGTPAGTAPPIYERAYTSLEAAGSLLSWEEASLPGRRRIQRLMLLASDPTAIDLLDEDATSAAGAALSRLCSSELMADADLFPADARQDDCSALVELLSAYQRNPTSTASAPARIRRIAELWASLMANVAPVPTPGGD